MKRNKELVDYTFEELVQGFTRDIHSGLLLGGGKGMESAVFMVLDTTLRWSKEQEKKIKEDKKKK
jgi:hypothetical protein